MLYALTFRVVDEGYLRMASLPIGEQSKGYPVVVAVQPDIHALKTALELANLTSTDRDSLLAFARSAYDSPGVDICCDQLELSADQLSILCMTPGRLRTLSASRETAS